jgi:hypothetical protein
VTGQRPALQVVRGEPTREEVAALVAVVAASAAAPAGQGATAGRGWANRSALLRRPTAPGPGAWRASARTR